MADIKINKRVTAPTVLIVEDEKPLAHALELKLAHEGLLVKAVNNGRDALTLLANEDFSLVICDLIMPHVDGFELLKQMRTKNVSIPVIVLTNLSQEEDRARVMKLGATDFFIKSDTPIATIVSHVKQRLKI